MDNLVAAVIAMYHVHAIDYVSHDGACNGTHSNAARSNATHLYLLMCWRICVV